MDKLPIDKSRRAPCERVGRLAPSLALAFPLSPDGTFSALLDAIDKADSDQREVRQFMSNPQA